VNEKDQLPLVFGSISEDMSNSIPETITKIIWTIFLVRDFRNIQGAGATAAFEIYYAIKQTCLYSAIFLAWFIKQEIY
jgi:hypothetical protein